MKKLILATIDNIPNTNFEIIDFVSFTNKDIAIYEYWYVEKLKNPDKENISVLERKKLLFGIIKKDIELENQLKTLQIDEGVDAIIGIRPDYHKGYMGNSYNGRIVLTDENIKHYIGTAIKFKTNKK